MTWRLTEVVQAHSMPGIAREIFPNLHRPVESFEIFRPLRSGIDCWPRCFPENILPQPSLAMQEPKRSQMPASSQGDQLNHVIRQTDCVSPSPLHFCKSSRWRAFRSLAGDNVNSRHRSSQFLTSADSCL